MDSGIGAIGLADSGACFGDAFAALPFLPLGRRRLGESVFVSADDGTTPSLLVDVGGVCRPDHSAYPQTDAPLATSGVVARRQVDALDRDAVAVERALAAFLSRREPRFVA